MARYDDEKLKALDFFQEDLKELLEKMKNDVMFMKRLAKNYQGYDFTEDLNDMIKEII